MFEDKEDEESLRALEKLEQLYTLGDVNFDSVIIIDFGSSLKSVLTSLVYTDVNQKKSINYNQPVVWWKYIWKYY